MTSMINAGMYRSGAQYGVLRQQIAQTDTRDPTLVLDLIGTTGIYTNVSATNSANVGDAVAAWRDEGNTALIATQAAVGARPTATADGLSFTGKIMLGNQAIRDLAGSISAITLYCVCVPNLNTGGQPMRWTETSSLTIAGLAFEGTIAVYTRRGGISFNYRPGAPYDINTPVVVSAVIDYGNRSIALYKNGALQGSTTSPTWTAGNTYETPGAFHIGADSQFLGDIRRLQAYHAVHDAATVAAITTQLAIQHGVSI